MKFRLFRFKLIRICLFSMLLTACVSTPIIFADYDHSHQFGNYKKFSWVGEDPGVVIGEALLPAKISSRTTNSIKDELEAKEFVFTPNANEADFLVSFTIGVREGNQVLQKFSKVWDNNENWLWGKEYHGYLASVWADGEPVTYTRGVLAIDIYDVVRSAPVWHGKATRSIQEGAVTPPGSNVELVVRKILKSFPPSE